MPRCMRLMKIRKSDIKMVNCAGCEETLLGESMLEYWRSLKPAKRKKLPNLVKGRILGRPYCGMCLGLKRQLDYRKGIDHYGCIESPSQQDALKVWEDLIDRQDSVGD